MADVDLMESKIEELEAKVAALEAAQTSTAGPPGNVDTTPESPNPGPPSNVDITPEP